MTTASLLGTSTASEALQETYQEGECHCLAVALHRHLGWELVAITNPDDPYWEDEEDADNFIPSVTHVYAVDPQHRAWDILGWRMADQMVPECRENFGGWNLTSDWMRQESELDTYVGYWGDEDPIERPLSAYTDADVAAAWEHAQAVFAALPEWQQALAARLEPETPARRGPRP